MPGRAPPGPRGPHSSPAGALPPARSLAKRSSPRATTAAVAAIGISLLIHRVVLTIHFRPFVLKPQRRARRSRSRWSTPRRSRSRPRPTSWRRRISTAAATPTPTAAPARRLPVLPKNAPDQRGRGRHPARRIAGAADAGADDPDAQRRRSRSRRGARRRQREDRPADGQRADAADAGGDAARSADRQGHGGLPEAAEAPVHRRARGGVPVCALCRGLAAQDRAHRQPQLSRKRRASRSSTAACCSPCRSAPTAASRTSRSTASSGTASSMRRRCRSSRCRGRSRRSRRTSSATPTSCTSRAPGRSRRPTSLDLE